LAVFFEFFDNIIDISLFKDVSVVFHVIYSELICLEHLEAKDFELNYASNLKINLGIKVPCDGIFVACSFQEFSAPNSAIFITVFIDRNGIVSAKEADYETSGVIFHLFRE
jgi:hypothetical protein